MLLMSQVGSPVDSSFNLSHLFEDSLGLTSFNGTLQTKLSYFEKSASQLSTLSWKAQQTEPRHSDSQAT
jgi:hypothetical protein